MITAMSGYQSHGLFKVIVKKALAEGVADAAFEETIYRFCAYLRVGRAYDFLSGLGEILPQERILLHDENHTRVNAENRFETGLELQIRQFSPQMKTAKAKAIPD